MKRRPFLSLALRVLTGVALLPLLGAVRASSSPSPAPSASPRATATPSASPTASPPTAKAKTRPLLRFDAITRLQPEYYDYFAPLGRYTNNYSFASIRTRPRLRYETDDWQACFMGQGVFLFGLPTNAVAPSPAGSLGMGGAYYSIDLRPDSVTLGVRELWFRAGRKDPNATALTAGRFDYSDGLEVVTNDSTLEWIKVNRLSKFLIGGPDYNAFGRTFDGLRADLDGRDLHFTGVIVHPTQVEPHFSTDIHSVLSQNYTLVFKDGFVPRGEAAVFFNQTSDTRLVPEVDNRPTALRGTIAGQGGNKFSTYGVRYVGRIGSNGDAMFYAAKQSGKWGNQTQDAWAAIAEFGWRVPKAPWAPWFRLGYHMYSGDPNPLDHRHQTWIGDIADARIKYNMYTNVNLNELFGELILKPTQKTSLRIDVRSFQLNQQADLWYSGNGATQQQGGNGFSGRPSGGSADVGNLLEITWENKMDEHNLLRLNLGQAWGGKVVKASYPAQAHGQLFYVEYHYIIP